jgi:glycosyltransferase involved in cell wall biosynthesis
MEVFIRALAKGLVGSGNEVWVIATDEQGSWFSSSTEGGVKTRFLAGLQSSSKASHARRVARFLRLEGFGVVINNNSWPVQASLGLLPDETAVISVIHNTSAPVLATSCANRQACNAFVAPSRAVFEGARALLLSDAKLHLIRHGVPVADCLPGHASAGEGLRVVYSGRLDHTQKGVLLLPGIAKRVAEAGLRMQFNIVGDGPDRDRLSEFVRQARVEQIVTMCGGLDHESSLNFMNQSDVLLMPSFYEGLPFALLEGMASGCVPVVSRLPGITDDLIDDEQNGFLVSPGDIVGFSECLIRLGRDAALLQRMRMKAWSSARDHWNSQTMINKYIELIDALGGTRLKRRDLPELTPDLVKIKDRLPCRIRSALGLGRRTLGRLFPRRDGSE